LKISTSQLRQIIKEEITRALQETEETFGNSNTIDLGQGFILSWGDNELGNPEAEITRNGDQIGFANAYAWDNEGTDLGPDDYFVNSLYIEEPFRRMGFGKWLILALSEAVREHTGNPSAKLYPADWIDRKEPDYRPGKSGTSDDALRVWKSFGGGPI
jgi:GNAT superfamily N-acetyltransferase